MVNPIRALASWIVRAAADVDPTDDRWYPGYGTGAPSRAGVDVSAETARTIATVYRCVSILANLLAMFPKGMYRRLERGREPAPNHPLDPLISFRPNRRQTAFEFWQTVCHHLILRQNAYVQIVHGPAGRGWVQELYPLHPDRVYGPEELENGRLRYEYAPPKGPRVTMMGGLDIWHLHGLSDDGIKGMSMIDLGRESFGTALAAERHAGRFFGQGVKPMGVIESDKSLKAEVADEMGNSFRRKWGGEYGAGGVPVLWEGVTFKAIPLNLKDQEFLDSRKFSATEVARWFGIPPHMVGDVERTTSWGSGITEQSLGFLTYSLLPWIELIEQSIRFTLVIQSDTYYAKMNPGAILRMAPDAQSQVFERLIKNGVLNPNECRELLERNPRPGGDEYVDPATAAAPPVPEPDLEPEPEPDPEPEPQAVAPMAQARLEELLEEEHNGLLRLAKRHAKSSDSWRAAVGGFYGTFVRRIEETKLCGMDRAREWCEARRDSVIQDGGLMQIDHGSPASAEHLLGVDRC